MVILLQNYFGSVGILDFSGRLLVITQPIGDRLATELSGDYDCTCFRFFLSTECAEVPKPLPALHKQIQPIPPTSRGRLCAGQGLDRSIEIRSANRKRRRRRCDNRSVWELNLAVGQRDFVAIAEALKVALGIVVHRGFATDDQEFRFDLG